MQITLNDQLTPTTTREYDLSNMLSSAISTHARKDIPRDADYWAKFNPIDELPKSKLHNTGLMGMLSAAYSNHLKVAFAPQDIWIVLLSEIAKEVNTNSAQYRALFTDSDEKKELSVPSGSMTHIPMASLSNLLSQNVLFDSKLLFPEFSTNNAVTTEVIQAIFCDMASPYYSYSMFCCGIPAIKLLGTQADWENLQSSWNKLVNIFDTPAMHKYGKQVDEILTKIKSTFTNPEGSIDFWKDIFTQKNVGSGGDLVISGWITQLFMTKHEFPKLTNFTATHGIVSYTQLETKRQFYRIFGGFDTQEDAEGFHQLAYSNYVFELEKQFKNQALRTASNK
jgi:hypothetical protein